MSAATFSTSSTTKTKKGFSEQDINVFLKRGASLASQGGLTPITAPGEQTRTTTKKVAKAGGIAQAFGAEDTGTTTTTSGFGGKFSDISKEQVGALTSAFKQREKSIAERRAQPGRTSLFMGRS